MWAEVTLVFLGVFLNLWPFPSSSHPSVCKALLWATALPTLHRSLGDHIPSPGAPTPIDRRLPGGHHQLGSSHRFLDGALCLFQWCHPGNISTHSHPASRELASPLVLPSHPWAAQLWHGVTCGSSSLLIPALPIPHKAERPCPAIWHLRQDATANVFPRVIYVSSALLLILVTALIRHLFLNYSNMPRLVSWPSALGSLWSVSDVTAYTHDVSPATTWPYHSLPPTLEWLLSPTAVVLYLGRTWESHGTAF